MKFKYEFEAQKIKWENYLIVKGEATKLAQDHTQNAIVGEAGQPKENEEAI